jgi:hypothetical protein
MSTITLSGNYGSDPYIAKGLASGTIIDATDAVWSQDNDGSDGTVNDYPVRVYDAPNLVLEGGTINGKIDQSGDWRTVYDMGNSAGVRTEDTPNVVIRDWHITNTWDAIRVSWDSPNFLIEDVWITNARDDAIENDRLQSGTIRDSLFDGVFAGLSIDPDSANPVDGHDQTVKMDGVLMRLKSYDYDGEVTHASFIKTDSATNGEVTPNLEFTNCVFALEDVGHRSYRSMFDAWSNTVKSSGNVFLNLSDTPLPSGYPKPPSGWTILQGDAARDYWDKAKAAWIAGHDGGGDAVTPPPLPDPDPTPTDPTPPDPLPTTPTDPGNATFSGVTFTGTDKAETIVGNALANIIDGGDGDDRIFGAGGADLLRGNEGADRLSGGAGNDIFLFRHLSDSRDSYGVDTITDFARGDRIDLSQIDANRLASGDQAFKLGGGDFLPGQIKISYDAHADTTSVLANVDADAEPELTIHLAGHVALAAADFIL